MWSIKKEKNELTCYNFVVGESYVVGRKSAQILLTEDPSISRRHAVFSILHPYENLADVSQPSVLKLKDESSKYGTFINGVQFEKDQEIQMKDGDVIRFGQFTSAFRVCFTPLVITTSCLQQSSKNELKGIMHKLGGHYVPEWRTSCTHLVMPDVKVTVKALCCLVALKPLVTPQYFSKLVASFMIKSEVPSVESYIPSIGEPLIDREKAVFSVNPARSVLFKDKTFIFFDDKQMKKLHLAVTIAGANSVLLNFEGTVDLTLLTKPDSCVIQPFGENTNDPKFASCVKKLAVALQRKKKRLIPESDFGLAVAYCSIEKFCNPDFDVGTNLLGAGKIESQTFSNAEVYVPDTEERQRSRNRAKLERSPLADYDILNRPSTSLNTSANRTVQESEEAGSNKRKIYSIFETATKRKRLDADSPSDSATVSGKNVEESKGESISNAASTSVKIKTEPVLTEPPAAVVTENDPGTVNVTDTEVAPAQSDITLKTTCQPPQFDSKTLFPEMSFSSSTAPQRLANGFLTAKSTSDTSALKQEAQEEDLPCNLMKITLMDLVKRQQPLEVPSTSDYDVGIVNFKKFKKVHHAGSQRLPRIIGGNDLMRHSDAAASRAMDDWVRENTENDPANSVDDHGEFDWDSQSRKPRVRGR